MYGFKYHRADTVCDALQALRESVDGKLLAGGMTLLPAMKQRLARPSDLIDIAAIPSLTGIRRAGDDVVIGAMTRHAEVATSPEVNRAIPALATLAGCIGDPQVRNRGTLGGAIANADPAADYPAALVGLGATVHTDSRPIAAEEFFVDMFETALKFDEIVVAVSFPRPQKSAYMKFPNPASRYALVGVMAARTAGGARVAITGAGPCVFRSREMEAVLDNAFESAALEGISIRPDGLNSDLHASAEYRAHLVNVMARRAVAAAV